VGRAKRASAHVAVEAYPERAFPSRWCPCAHPTTSSKRRHYKAILSVTTGSSSCGRMTRPDHWHRREKRRAHVPNAALGFRRPSRPVRRAAGDGGCTRAAERGVSCVDATSCAGRWSRPAHRWGAHRALAATSNWSQLVVDLQSAPRPAPATLRAAKCAQITGTATRAWLPGGRDLVIERVSWSRSWAQRIGKSTCLNVLGCLDQPPAVFISFCIDIAGLDAERWPATPGVSRLIFQTSTFAAGGARSRT